MLKDARPRLRVTGTDLSQPYLRETQRNLADWSRTGLVHANAEELPFADASYDTLSCVFLFHELPQKARLRAAAEMARVLKPGGRLFFLDQCRSATDRIMTPCCDDFRWPFTSPITTISLRAI